MEAKDSWSWVSTGSFTVLGCVLVWWANEQWLDITEIAATSFSVPSARLLLWLLTLIATGVSFGLVVSASQSRRARPRVLVLLVWAVIPFAILFLFWSQIALGWFQGVSLAGFLYSEITLVAAGIVLGVLIAGMLGPSLFGSADAPGAEIETVEEVEDVEGDVEGDVEEEPSPPLT